MVEFFSFFIILLAALSFSVLFARFHLPWVLALIIGGIVIGPHGFGWLEINETVSFLGQIGLVFLMFMAGLETPISKLKSDGKEIVILAAFNGIIPFFVGLGIGFYFDYGITASLLLGIIFISSSVAIIVPSLQTNNLLKKSLGRSILAATVVLDVSSLIFLSILLQITDPVTALPLPIFYGLLIIVLILLRWTIKTMHRFFNFMGVRKKDAFEQEFRAIFVILIGTVILFGLLGLHPIVAGFFAGLVLSESIKSDVLKQKLHAISYGVFIPIFFIIIGANTDLDVFLRANDAILLTIVVVIASLFSKYASGYVGGRISGFTQRQSALMASATIPQLSTTLAVVFLGFTLGILDDKMVTAMIILSVMTTFVAPILINYFAKGITFKEARLKPKRPFS